MSLKGPGFCEISGLSWSKGRISKVEVSADGGTSCAACHGDKGEGKANAQLVGGQITGGPVVKTVGSYWPYATTLFDFTRRAVPWTAPKSLTNDEVYEWRRYQRGAIGPS
jgi:hypothetical protein